MGLDTTCSATFKKQTSTGRVQLETDYVLFRGDFRVKLPLTSITAVSAQDGRLSLKSAEGTLVLASRVRRGHMGREDPVPEEPRREARRQGRRARLRPGY